MELKGKITIFKNSIETKDGLKDLYKTTISNKDENGNYTNLSLDVHFVGKKFSSEKLAKLDAKSMHIIEINEGFLSVRKYIDKDGNEKRVPVVVISDAKYLEARKFVSKDNPF